MPQSEIELVLMRQLASYLAMPCIIVGPAGEVLFFNEPAEAIYGRRFEEAGTVRPEDWASLLPPTDLEGMPLNSGELPLAVALRDKQPAYGHYKMRAADGVVREVEGIAFPLVGRTGHMLGAVGIFWQKGSK